MRNSAGFLHGLGSVLGRLWGCFWDPGPLILSVSCKRDANSQKFVFYMLTLPILLVPYAFASENLFQFQAPDIDGEKLSLRQFEGQVVLVVNTASKCGLVSIRRCLW